MKMAKATEKDMDAALAMCRALESLENGYLPDEMTEGQDEPVWYSEEKHAADVVKFLVDIQKRASIFRVSFGMTVLLDPANEIVDPGLSHLELHPRLRDVKADQEAASKSALAQGAATDLLVQRAQEVIDRWDSPLWKDLPPTAECINRLRLAVAEMAMPT